MAVHRQPDGDLGERMLAAVTSITERGQPVLVIGSDCPILTAGYLRAAADGLRDEDVVIGPSEDGGYGLIGMRRVCSSLFLDMHWSVADVCRETRRRAERANLGLIELPTLWDVDTVADWRRWRALSVFPP
jgi:rSAM/selenodomain-associated transferase 1